MGAERCVEMMTERVPGGAEAVVIDSDFRLVTTPDTTDRLRWNMQLEDGHIPH